MTDTEFTLIQATARAKQLEELVAAIHDTLSGHEWDSDTLGFIAELLNANGWPIREPDESDHDDELAGIKSLAGRI